VPVTPGRAAASRWLDRWRPLLPLVVAEAVIWFGFGAILPVLPLFVSEQGIDPATLGIVIAAWPAARLVAEPIFGMLADRVGRVPLMVMGLVAGALFAGLPLLAHGAGAFIVLRALSGVAAALYDPAARGYIVDATAPEERGEAFGLYAAFQTSGIFLGPLAGALAAGIVGSTGVVFLLGAAAQATAAIAIARGLRERTHVRAPSIRPLGLGELPPDIPAPEERAVGPRAATAQAPRSLANRDLAAVLCLNFGVYFAGGSWEVVWSLFLTARGYGLGFIGLTVALYGLPALVLSPFVGRRIDRVGVWRFIAAGMLATAAAGVLYPVAPNAVAIIALVLIETVGWTLVGPALYTLVARGSPADRLSTAQGIAGTAGTLGSIIASLAAGRLFAIDQAYPFIAFALVIVGSLFASILVQGLRILRRRDHAGMGGPGP
jgi:MFS transporter, DHA1 family, multidrug resistance protein